MFQLINNMVIHGYWYFYVILDVRKARVPIETIQEKEERHLCEEKTTSSNISNEEGAEVSKIFIVDTDYL